MASRLEGLRAARLLAAAAALGDRSAPPRAGDLSRLVFRARALLDSEDPEIRPRDSSGLPGGLLDLPDLPAVLVPDLHARPGFLAAVLAWRPPLGAEAGRGAGGASPGPRLAELLSRGEALLLCLGDAFHSEGRGAAERWRAALGEYASGWASRRVMDGEMARALACVELILRAKLAFPASFHYLKGNHDNIADEEGRGDHSFYKYAAEGEMAASWFEATYGKRLLAEYRALELSLPLAARGRRFVASHAEPAFALRPEDIVEYRRRPDVVLALTWTPNEGAAPGSVAEGLRYLLGPGSPEGSRWFGGHRPVEGRYALRAGGRYVQFHDPEARRVVLLLPGRDPDPGSCVLDLA